MVQSATPQRGRANAETIEETHLAELCHGEAISQAELPGSLELVAVFDEDDRGVPVHLGKGSAA
jgi:hypothetical protein